MTKTKKQNSRASSHKGTSARSHSWVLALVILLIIIAVVTVVICVVKPWSTTSDSSTPTTSQQPEDSSTSDSDSSTDDSTTPEDSESPENKVPQYEGENPNDLEELTGVIISKYIENGVLTVMATINQYLHQTGTCVITLTGQNYHNSYTASSDAHADITTSYCENFEIPVSELTPDTYSIEIKLTGDGKTGTIRGEEITL